MRVLWFASLALCSFAANASGGGKFSGPAAFGKTSGGEKVEMVTLTNKNGMVAKFITRGAALAELQVPDKDGKLANVVLGFDNAAGYESDANQYFGCVTGRVANRIAKGKFTLDGKEYKLAINNDPNHLHGGVKKSLDKVIWLPERRKEDPACSIRFAYTSVDGEEGYPGNVAFQVLYTLTDDNELKIEYMATTDKATPINLTNHSYFNLAGAGSDSVLDHKLFVSADKYTPTDDTLIPTGKIADVKGTPLDFTEPHPMRQNVETLIKTSAIGLDHNFVIKDHQKGKVVLAAKLGDPGSRRLLTVYTDQPGIQIYTGNYLKGQKGKDGKTYNQRSAVCLETQNFPNAVNEPAFPSPVLRPGETYRHTCIFAFSVVK
ncbi:MAG: galactose mutarotase [Planctomycetes bacterium]|nr:galactose mutarotase [Planctomycetota bacterium]